MKKQGVISIVAAVLLLSLCTTAWARREIRIPDIQGYRTLKCDLHMHTVFSDGNVWPTVRVDEAWREGLDVIAITDHIEYQPHKKEIPTDHNRPYEIALGRAKAHGLLLIRGAEITRDTPPGHFNALFLDGLDVLDEKDFLKQMRAAKEHNAYVFWNHPGWKARSGENYILDIHNQLRQEGLIQGVEIVNGDSHYLDAHTWALKHGFTLIGNSDIHSPADSSMVGPENHRTVTLVFAREKTVEDVREALAVGRTAVWVDNTLVGKAEFLRPILEESIRHSETVHRDSKAITVKVPNMSDITYELEKSGGNGPARITLPANETVLVRLPIAKDGQIHLSYTVTNLLVGPQEGLKVETSFSADQ